MSSLARGTATEVGCAAIKAFRVSIRFSAGSVSVSSTSSFSSSGFAAAVLVAFLLIEEPVLFAGSVVLEGRVALAANCVGAGAGGESGNRLLVAVGIAGLELSVGTGEASGVAAVTADSDGLGTAAGLSMGTTEGDSTFTGLGVAVGASGVSAGVCEGDAAAGAGVSCGAGDCIVRGRCCWMTATGAGCPRLKPC